MWIDQALSSLSCGQSYSRGDLFRIFGAANSSLTGSTFRWTLYSLLQNRLLFRADYDTYVTSQPTVLPVYRPFYSEQARSLLQFISEKYPHLSFVVFESTLLNEFLNQLIAQNTIYIQVERAVSSYIFDVIRDEFPCSAVLYKPNMLYFDRYWSRDCIVVLDLVSQSPLSQATPHEMTAEKLLVDIVAEKTISAVFSPAELPFIFDNVLETCQVESRKLFRYAGRRGKLPLLNQYMDNEQ